VAVPRPDIKPIRQRPDVCQFPLQPTKKGILWNYVNPNSGHVLSDGCWICIDVFIVIS